MHQSPCGKQQFTQGPHFTHIHAETFHRAVGHPKAPPKMRRDPKVSIIREKARFPRFDGKTGEGKVTRAQWLRSWRDSYYLNGGPTGRAGEDDPELSSLLLSILWPGPKLADKKLKKGVHRDQSPRIQTKEKNGWGRWGGRKK